MNDRGVIAGAAAVAALCFGCDGPPGPQGLAGPQGPRGLDGRNAGSAAPAVSALPASPYALAGSTAATPYRPLVWISCHVTMDLVTASGSSASLGMDGLNETLLVYRATIFTNGDTDSSCTASIGSAQDGSGSSYYPASTVGSEDASCMASSDYPPFNIEAGFWRFAASPDMSPRAKYVDAGHPLDGRSYVFQESDCSIMVLGQGGEWKDADFGIFSR